MTTSFRFTSPRSLASALRACCLITTLLGCAEEDASLTVNTNTGAANAADGGARGDGGAAGDAGSRGDGGGALDGGGGKTTDKPGDASSGGGDSKPVEVTVKNGKLQGKKSGDARVFLGIPYAKPPVAELRFMPPEPAEPWKGTKMATEYGPSCLQNASSLSAMGELGEDCLTLNVFAPESDKKLPVMVWIHGGAFVAGGSNQYDGVKLATTNGVIVVTLNYRLGVLGFLAHPALEGEQHGGVPSGNDALRDQQLAIKWVRDNIDKFGGDPKNVTVFGESAGSASTCIHAMSPLGKELGERFIMESGACWGSFLLSTKEKADNIGLELTDELCQGEDDVIACLQGLDPVELVKWGSDRGLTGAGWNPVINPDDELFPKHPAEIVAAKEHTKAPILIGTNKNEWALFMLLQMTDVSTVDKLNDALEVQFENPPGLADAVKQHYVTDEVTDATASQVFVRAVTDAAFRCPSRGLARAVSAAGNKVFLYSFEYGPAMHAGEIPYVFGNPSAALGVTNTEPMRPVMQTYWTQFAKTGSPNGGDQPEWPEYDAEGDQHMTLDMPPSAGEGHSKDDCDFWDALTAPR